MVWDPSLSHRVHNHESGLSRDLFVVIVKRGKRLGQMLEAISTSFLSVSSRIRCIMDYRLMDSPAFALFCMFHNILKHAEKHVGQAGKG